MDTPAVKGFGPSSESLLVVALWLPECLLNGHSEKLPYQWSWTISATIHMGTPSLLLSLQYKQSKNEMLKQTDPAIFDKDTAYLTQTGDSGD